MTRSALQSQTICQNKTAEAQILLLLTLLRAYNKSR